MFRKWSVFVLILWISLTVPEWAATSTVSVQSVPDAAAPSEGAACPQYPTLLITNPSKTQWYCQQGVDLQWRWHRIDLPRCNPDPPTIGSACPGDAMCRSTANVLQIYGCDKNGLWDVLGGSSGGGGPANTAQQIQANLALSTNFYPDSVTAPTVWYMDITGDGVPDWYFNASSFGRSNGSGSGTFDSTGKVQITANTDSTGNDAWIELYPNSSSGFGYKLKSPPGDSCVDGQPLEYHSADGSFYCDGTDENQSSVADAAQWAVKGVDSDYNGTNAEISLDGTNHSINFDTNHDGSVDLRFKNTLATCPNKSSLVITGTDGSVGCGASVGSSDPFKIIDIVEEFIASDSLPQQRCTGTDPYKCTNVTIQNSRQRFGHLGWFLVDGAIETTKTKVSGATVNGVTYPDLAGYYYGMYQYSPGAFVLGVDNAWASSAALDSNADPASSDGNTRPRFLVVPTWPAEDGLSTWPFGAPVNTYFEYSFAFPSGQIGGYRFGFGMFNPRNDVNQTSWVNWSGVSGWEEMTIRSGASNEGVGFMLKGATGDADTTTLHVYAYCKNTSGRQTVQLYNDYPTNSSPVTVTAGLKQRLFRVRIRSSDNPATPSVDESGTPDGIFSIEFYVDDMSSDAVKGVCTDYLPAGASLIPYVRMALFSPDTSAPYSYAESKNIRWDFFHFHMEPYFSRSAEAWSW